MHIPFFAARSGKLPPSGAPVVAGVHLPQGSRCGRFWSTDAGVKDAFGLARRLAAAFSSTGLWPVVWAWPGEEPDAYVHGTGNPARADSLNAEALLRRSWRVSGLARTGPFPGLAARSTQAHFADPFRTAASVSEAESPPPNGWVVMLVPVNRPADIYSALGTQTTEYFSDNELTAILRSWEERFGAVVTTLTPSTVDLAVDAPPANGDQARRLAAEQAALQPDDSADDLKGLADELQSARVWTLGWPD